jgi:hypothetical protein
MEKISHQKNIISKFKKMEIESSFFKLKYKNKFAVWDLCRRDIFIEIVRVKDNLPKYFSYEIKSNDKYKNFFKKFYNFLVLFFLRFKRAETLAITFRRSKKKNLSYDFSVDPIANKFNDCFFLDFANPSIFKALFFRNFSYFSYKTLREPYNDIDDISKYIDNKVFEKFNIDISSKEIINYSLNCFFSGELFFRNLIKSLKCRKVIYVDNGNIKFIPYVCNIKRLVCFEAQDGATEGSISVNYPKKKELLLNKENSYYPDFYISWGKYWNKIYNLPSKFIVGGTENYIEKCNHSNKILFISSTRYYLDLSFIAKEVAKALPNKKILFKLHPDQFTECSKIKLDFKNQKNIKVILDEIDNKKLLLESSDFVAIRSTFIYQALQSGCRGHILKKHDYNCETKILKFVQQFSTPGELLANLNHTPLKTDPPIFFEKISVNNLSDYL